MNSMKNKLKAILYVPLVSLFLLFGFLPVQSAHAGSMSMDHSMSGPTTNAKNCCNSSSTTAVLKEEEQLPAYEQDDEPEPPEQTPFYAGLQFFPEPQQPASTYTGSSMFRPPDLVKLYANFRF